MSRKPTPNRAFAQAIARLLVMAPDGPMSVSELARRAGVPRSTVHRHLKGGQPQRDTLTAYARVLNVPLNQLLGLAGYPVPRSEAFDDQVKALASELADLGPEDLQLVREMMEAIRRRSQRVGHRDRGQEDALQDSPPS